MDEKPTLPVAFGSYGEPVKPKFSLKQTREDIMQEEALSRQRREQEDLEREKERMQRIKEDQYKKDLETLVKDMTLARHVDFYTRRELLRDAGIISEQEYYEALVQEKRIRDVINGRQGQEKIRLSHLSKEAIVAMCERQYVQNTTDAEKAEKKRLSNQSILSGFGLIPVVGTAYYLSQNIIVSGAVASIYTLASITINAVRRVQLAKEKQARLSHSLRFDSSIYEGALELDKSVLSLYKITSLANKRMSTQDEFDALRELTTQERRIILGYEAELKQYEPSLSEKFNHIKKLIDLFNFKYPVVSMPEKSLP